MSFNQIMKMAAVTAGVVWAVHNFSQKPGIVRKVFRPNSDNQ